MRWLKLTLAYDGTDYHGWQWQPGVPTVQAQVERALERVTGQARRVTASGRTDAGVHALQQIASCATDSSLPPDTLCRAMNANLPHDIRVGRVDEAAEGFDAVTATASKRYRYVIQDGPVHDVFRRRYAWFIPTRLDVGAMAQGALSLIGRHDFRAYQTAGSPRQSTVRHLTQLEVARRRCDGCDLVLVQAHADGFLYNMVRNLVGTLVRVGQGKEDPDWPRHVLAGGDRRCGGPTAPPHGLALARVYLHDPHRTHEMP